MPVQDYTYRLRARKLWRTLVGPIPAGYHIHHIDHDPSNNALTNLACLSPSEHIRLHHQDERTWPILTKTCRTCQKTYQTKWPKSKSCSVKCITRWRMLHELDVVDRACERCGTMFRCVKAAPNRFCTITCAKRGVPRPKQTFHCASCGVTFQSASYLGTDARCCSGRCYMRVRRAEAQISAIQEVYDALSQR
jgi:hypothetical protein